MLKQIGSHLDSKKIITIDDDFEERNTQDARNLLRPGGKYKFTTFTFWCYITDPKK